jgi:hypothetical protein
MADTEERVASSVVTSINAAEFYAERLGLADQDTTEADTSSEPAEIKEQSKPEAEEEAKEAEAEKPKDKLNKRFEKVSRRAEEAEAKAREYENRLKEYEARGTEPAVKKVVEGKPDASQFNDAFEYAEALAEWSAENALKQRDEQEAVRKQQAEQEKITKSWNKKLDKAKAQYSDFDDVVKSANTVVGNEIRDSILESDVGPQLLYFLASDEDFAKKLTEMPVIKALREIGKLEARFERKEEPKVATAPRSKAPEPIKTLSGGKAGADVLIDTNGEFHGTYAQWKAARLANRVR